MNASYLPDNISVEYAPDAPLSRADRGYFAEVQAENEREAARDSLEAAHNAICLALDEAVRDGDGVGAQAALRAMHSAAALLAGAAS